jgi:hypothetical protein
VKVFLREALAELERGAYFSSLLARIFHEHPGSGADLATKDPPEQG